jgi:hypothetical protein
VRQGSLGSSSGLLKALGLPAEQPVEVELGGIGRERGSSDGGGGGAAGVARLRRLSEVSEAPSRLSALRQSHPESANDSPRSSLNATVGEAAGAEEAEGGDSTGGSPPRTSAVSADV